MLEQKITTKQELMRLIQSVLIKKIIASDVHTRDDIQDMCRAAEQLLRSNQTATMFIITT
jgi:hypothetical protein